MENIQVKIKKLNSNARMPVYGSSFAAGMDLYACMEDCVTIAPGETAMIHTQLSMEIPAGYAGMIYARSGLATKKGLAPANKVGVIDADYRGEIMIALHNHSQEERTVENGERVAQMVITPVPAVELIETETLEETDRGAGGFGSTGSR